MRYVLALLLLALIAAIGAALTYRGNAAQAAAQRAAAETSLEAIAATANSLREALGEERARADRMSAIAEQTEQEMRDVEQAAADTVADLRAGNLRLREQWRGCPEPRLPGIDAPAGEADAATRDREQGAGRIVRAAAECDAQVRGLQRVIREYLGETTP